MQLYRLKPTQDGIILPPDKFRGRPFFLTALVVMNFVKVTHYNAMYVLTYYTAQWLSIGWNGAAAQGRWARGQCPQHAEHPERHYRQHSHLQVSRCEGHQRQLCPPVSPSSITTHYNTTSSSPVYVMDDGP